MSSRGTGDAEGERQRSTRQRVWEGRKVVGFQLDEFLAGSLRNPQNQIGPELWSNTFYSDLSFTN